MEAVLWILLMFSEPEQYKDGKIEVLNTFTRRNKCHEEMQRAMDIAPPNMLFTCIKMKMPRMA